MKIIIYSCDLCGKKESEIERLILQLSDGKVFDAIDIKRHLCQKCYIHIREKVEILYKALRVLI